jgi:hypothetical protein
VRIAVVFLVAISVVACDASAPVAPTIEGHAVSRPATPVARSGRTLDFGTGAGVPNVAVALGNLDFSGQFAANATAITNPTGSYTLSIARGLYISTIGAEGFGQVQILGGGDAGNFLVNTGTCVSRYGYVVDLLTGDPIEGARVTLSGNVISSDAAGWYRVDLGCPANRLVGFNTTFISVSHPGYQDGGQVVGRGVFGTSRLDIALARRTAF